MIRPKKKYGQHFLRDDNIAGKITGSLSPDQRNIIEIGPGTGILTRRLLEKKNANLLFFEIDPEAVQFLEEKFPEIRGKLICEDFLEYDLSQVPYPFCVIGNFPYNISSQILFRVLEYRDRVPEVVGMFQKEVAERIAAPPGSKTYGILSVLLQAYYDIEYLFTVSPHLFFPSPKVKSAVIRLKRNSTVKLPCDESLFFNLVKTAFNQRRKTLRNSLKEKFSVPPAGLKEMMSLRAEQLSVNDFVQIARVLLPL
jgi:16S rRNA (adenine1518-N6/adenine1519-N6)-dimethyltransferase